MAEIKRINPAGAELESLYALLYVTTMTWEELTPEAIEILTCLLTGPRGVADGPMLQLLFADRLVKGTPTQVQITQLGRRLVVQYIAATMT